MPALHVHRSTRLASDPARIANGSYALTCEAGGEAILHWVDHLVQPLHYWAAAVQNIAPHSQHQRVKSLDRSYTYVRFK